ncbi:hydroxypyruvate reductase [Pelagimonas varians]|uniref:Hydroxypyruvate reductase n=1 Tax=Pelagimonas varians TaxID=696760 RepID=A0A238L1M4_9RHOB|nr:hydroxypyruvate reductase [Pelagimonas varians]SMX48721.1 Putative hydroxypyruvate reductase [Pelagimonas varians]
MTQGNSYRADRKQRAVALWNAGTHAANGTFSVRKAIETQGLTAPSAIVSIGKAASAMALGALEKFEVEIPTLVITKYDHTAPELAANATTSVIEAAHPIPDENSLIAGRKALDFVTGLTAEDRLMLLISGGASSLAEVLAPGITLDDLKSLNQDMISQDRTIEEINAARRKLSLIKSGGLLSHFKGAHVDVIFISDVLKDDPNVIGSGIGSVGTQTSPPFSINSFVAANNQQSRQAVADEVTAQNLPVIENAESLYGEISDLAKTLAEKLRNGENGVYVWGGEPVVNLPENPGNGGRNQALALLLARELHGQDDIAIVVGGTDGTDGPTAAAGGVVDGNTYDRDQGHDAAIAQANAGDALAGVDSLLITGPTGTNVMDLIVAVKGP